MSSKEFAEWQAFYRLNPNDIDKLSAYLAQVTQYLVKSIDPKGKPKLKDYYLSFGPREKMDDDEMVSARKAIQSANPDMFVRKPRKKREV